MGVLTLTGDEVESALVQPSPAQPGGVSVVGAVRRSSLKPEPSRHGRDTRPAPGTHSHHTSH